jgi:hypothetical protein
MPVMGTSGQPSVAARSCSAAARASAREWTASLRMMFLMCERTVSVESTSMSATSSGDRPGASRSMTSHSREVRGPLIGRRPEAPPGQGPALLDEPARHGARDRALSARTARRTRGNASISASLERNPTAPGLLPSTTSATARTGASTGSRSTPLPRRRGRRRDPVSVGVPATRGPSAHRRPRPRAHGRPLRPRLAVSSSCWVAGRLQPTAQTGFVVYGEPQLLGGGDRFRA